MKNIQAKKEISVKEFELIYNIGSTTQGKMRSGEGIYGGNKIPYKQSKTKKGNGTISYNVLEVERWFINNKT